MSWLGKLAITTSILSVVMGVAATIIHANRRISTRTAAHKLHTADVEMCRTVLSHLEAFDNLAPTGCGSDGCVAAERALRQRVVVVCRKALVTP